MGKYNGLFIVQKGMDWRIWATSDGYYIVEIFDDVYETKFRNFLDAYSYMGELTFNLRSLK